MADTAPTIPSRPEHLVGQHRDYWNALVERFEHVDKDIRGAEALRDSKGIEPPKWYHYRRAERAALAWALQQICDLAAFRETARAVDVMR